MAAQAKCLAESSWKTRRSQWKDFMQFCSMINIVPVPVSAANLCRYIAFMARRLKYTSIINYLSAAKQLHLMFDADTTVFESFVVKATLKGFKRILGGEIVRKLPITLDILKAIIPKLYLDGQSGIAAAVLFGFFSFARKANLVPPSAAGFDANKHLCRGSFLFTSWGVVVKFAYTKTIQCYERVLYVPVYANKHPVLCAVKALKLHFAKFPAKEDDPAFYISSQGESIPLTHHTLVKGLKDALAKTNYNPDLYSGHSMRRGGSSFAHEIGIDLPLIQSIGDWASLSVLCYLTRPLSLRMTAAQSMAEKVDIT